MTSKAALAFVRRHGVVLEGARGPVPNLAEAVATGPIRGLVGPREGPRDLLAHACRSGLGRCPRLSPGRREDYLRASPPVAGGGAIGQNLRAEESGRAA